MGVGRAAGIVRWLEEKAGRVDGRAADDAQDERLIPGIVVAGHEGVAGREREVVDRVTIDAVGTSPHEQALLLPARLHPHEVCAEIGIISTAEAHLRGEALAKRDNAAAGQWLDIDPARPLGGGHGEDQSSPASGKGRGPQETE